MRLMILGAPGVGKGSQATILSRTLSIPHISTGDILREKAECTSTLGVMLKQYMNQGSLVPDEIIIEIVKERIRRNDCSNGFILDGFPRTFPQVTYLDSMLEDEGIQIDAIVNISLSDDEIVRRLGGRRICPTCKAVFHVDFKKPERDGICDECNTPLFKRDDDSELIIRKRLHAYHAQTEPLMAHYENNIGVIHIESDADIQSTTIKVFHALGLNPVDYLERIQSVS